MSGVSKPPLPFHSEAVGGAVEKKKEGITP
jgi:hypothetical protein